MIEVQLIGSEALLIRFGGFAKAAHDSLRVVMEDLAIEMQTKVKQKLSGDVLHNRTGTLRRSINYRMMDDGSNISAAVGTNIVYAAIHEYGFSGSETVRAHIRRSRVQMAQATHRYKKADGSYGLKTSMTGKFGKKTGVIQVRSFTRNMVMPERSYLRSTLKEMAPTIRKRLADAVIKAVVK